MPTTATLTGTGAAGQTLTCTLTGYASDIFNYDWMWYAASSGGSGTRIRLNNSSSVTDDVDTIQLSGELVGKYVGCTAGLDGESAASNRIGPVRGGSGARRGKPSVIVRDHDAIRRKIAKDRDESDRK